jgi:hypothetical protein
MGGSIYRIDWMNDLRFFPTRSPATRSSWQVIQAELARPKSFAASQEKELAAFREKLPTLLSEEGRFALVHGSEIEGYRLFQLEPFLVKEIKAT